MLEHSSFAKILHTVSHIVGYCFGRSIGTHGAIGGTLSIAINSMHLRTVWDVTTAPIPSDNLCAKSEALARMFFKARLCKQSPVEDNYWSCD